MTTTATLIPEQLQRDITKTLASLRMARIVDPQHRSGQRHSACDVCTAERRLDWLLTRVRKLTGEQ